MSQPSISSGIDQFGLSEETKKYVLTTVSSLEKDTDSHNKMLALKYSGLFNNIMAQYWHDKEQEILARQIDIKPIEVSQESTSIASWFGGSPKAKKPPTLNASPKSELLDLKLQTNEFLDWFVSSAKIDKKAFKTQLSDELKTIDLQINALYGNNPDIVLDPALSQYSPKFVSETFPRKTQQQEVQAFQDVAAHTSSPKPIASAAPVVMPMLDRGKPPEKASAVPLSNAAQEAKKTERLVSFDGIEKFDMSSELRQFVKSTLTKIHADEDNQNKILSLKYAGLMRNMVEKYVNYNIEKLPHQELKEKLGQFGAWILKTADVKNISLEDFSNELESVHFKIDSHKLNPVLLEPKPLTQDTSMGFANGIKEKKSPSINGIVDIVYDHMTSNKDKSLAIKNTSNFLKNTGVNISTRTLKGLMRESEILVPSSKKKNVISSIASKVKDKIHEKLANSKAKEFKKLWTDRVQEGRLMASIQIPEKK